MKPDPNYSEYVARWSEIYEHSNYDSGLASYFLRKSHEWCEATIPAAASFGKVIEVGAGTGVHLRFIRHPFEEYWLTDLHPPMLERTTYGPALCGRIHLKREDATRLSFENGSFDRLIAAHVLEHLPNPHLVLREWVRVVRPGGVISLILPCDPGLAWRLGRTMGPRRTFVRLGIDYDYWMAREHINSVSNLVSLVRYYFDDFDEYWRPTYVPSMDANLFYIAHIRVRL